MLVQTNMGPLPYEAIVAQINARYAEGKTPDLAVKSALQLGIDPAIIATLPGVDENAMRRGLSLISSGAFSEAATGTSADIQTAAPVGSAQYNARKAAGLDAFGFPPEEVAKLTAAGLYGPGRQFDPGDMAQPAQNFSGLFSSGKVLEDQAQQVLAASGKANDPRFTDSIVGSFVQDGVAYNVLGDGSLQGVIESPTGAVLVGGFTPTGEQATEGLDTRFEQTSLDRALGILANAAIAAGTGFALGPAGVGALGVPGAAAAGAGLTNLVNTADLESALRAAALGGATAFGIEQLFPTDALKAARTATDLATSGNSIDSITQTLVNQGVSPATARTIAAEALAGSSASQIASDFAGQVTLNAASTAAPTATSVSPDLVNILGTKFNPATGLFSTGAGSLLGAGVGSTVGIAPSIQPATLPQVQVTGQTLQPETSTITTPEVLGATLPVVTGGNTQQAVVEGTKVTKQPSESTTAAVTGAIIPGIQPAVPSAAEQVQVTEKKATTPSKESVAATLGTIIPSITAAVPSAAEQVQVTGKKETPPDITVPALSAALPAIPAAVKATLPEPVKPPAKKEDSLFTPSDILKLLTLLGGTAAVSGAGTGTAPVGNVPPSDRMIGSTTPQFGDDYYAAVQRYYNAYMPETPRNVAGPLQQWYENKYGA
jgi:hypothetical protein